MLLLSAKEIDLMVEAVDAGEKVFVRLYGNNNLLRGRTRESVKAVVRSGDDVPHELMCWVCMGLEYMYFCDNRQGEGIADLLGKLANMCGYQRFGALMLELKESA